MACKTADIFSKPVRRTWLFTWVTWMILSVSGCGIYSLNGVYMPPEVKTVYIANFPNNAPLVQPLLSQKFTEALKDVFTRQSNLKLVLVPGDISIEGEIVGYEINPVAVQGDQVAAANRLTIRVKVKYTNTKEKNKDFETTFSRYVDYANDVDFTAQEENLMDEVNQQLTQDIFDRIMINW
ncbi:MAG: LptE family protein [Flavobacteriales bacterium]|nr:LptE family protein [Flavobacteriales bacterium]MCB9449437.1 LptE family protein [Flavobacteriales bacterium]